jgi:hypothetical protein
MLHYSSIGWKAANCDGNLILFLAIEPYGN